MKWFTHFEQLERLLIVVFCFALPFGARLILWQPQNQFFPYTTVFLYATDLVVVALVALSVIKGRVRLPRMPSPIAVCLLALTGIGFISALLNGLSPINITALIRLALYGAFALILAKGISTLHPAFVMIPLFLSGVFQSALAWFQFGAQHHLGLLLLGEAALAPDIAGVAKIEVFGEKLVRAYGTFPHPNVLAAFLLLAIGTSAYFYLRGFSSKISLNVAWLGGIALMLGAFLFTFSRSAWLAFAIGLGIAGIYGILGKKKLATTNSANKILVSGPPKEGSSKRVLALGIVFASAILFAWLFFPEEIKSRSALALEDQAVQSRISSAYWAMQMIDGHRMFGVGPGRFVEKIERYAGQLPEQWMYQPVHNLYLLFASEFGIIGLVTLLFLIGFGFRAWKTSKNPSVAIFIPFLFLGLFDHYLATFAQGIALFWLAVALMLARDRIYGKLS